MGCWNETCALSNTPIHHGDPVVGFMLAIPGGHGSNNDSCYTDGVAFPLGFPIFGTYNDYGNIENKASLEGGDQVKSFSPALQFAGEVSAKAYGEKDATYWVSYYKGQTKQDKQDKQGLMVELGGSKVNNLSDNIALFGLKGTIFTLGLLMDFGFGYIRTALFRHAKLATR